LLTPQQQGTKRKKLLRDAEQKNLIQYLAANPKAGVLVQGTGGIRKLRWKRDSSE